MAMGEQKLPMRRQSCSAMLFTCLVLTGCEDARSVAHRTAAASAQANVGLKKGQRAPEIVGRDIDGRQFKLTDYRGKVVLLDFWATW
jgi:hypothetical protein